MGSHSRISPDLSADTNVSPSGDHTDDKKECEWEKSDHVVVKWYPPVHNTWSRCPRQVCCGMCVTVFQKRTALSPPPEARREPSGLYNIAGHGC